MASRTKQKEEARARRLAEEQERAERARRQHRLRLIGGTVLGAIIVVVAAILISTSGGSSGSSGLKTGTQANATVNSVNQLLGGIPQSGSVLGNPKAPVTMTYYGDLKCPFCRDFTLRGGFPQLVANEVRSGKVKVDYKAFCTATCNGPAPNEFNTQQVAALAAGKQGKFWQFAELFYRQQGSEQDAYVTESFLNNLATQAGLNISQWQTDRNDPALLNQVNADQNAARQVGVSGTPTLLFTGPKGQAQAGANSAVPSYADLQQAVKQVS